MFKLTIEIKEKEYKGINALDMRRKLGLSDGVYLFVNNIRQTFDISEVIAREKEIFYNDDHPSIEVDAAYLKNGEFAIKGNRYITDLTISQKRAEELLRENCD